MPIYLRKVYLQMLVDAKKAEADSYKSKQNKGPRIKR
jgi:hypothetical protein